MTRLLAWGAPELGEASILRGRYTDPLPIRSRGAFQLLSAKRASDGRRCVVVLPGRTADPARVAEALAEVARAHATIDHPGVPRVTARETIEGTPTLELACDAVIDAMELLRLLADHERLVPYEAADGFIVGLRKILQAAHASRDPATGKGVCLGRISLGNVLLGPDGTSYLLGFGRNFPIEKETGVIDGTSVHFQAPELSVGAAPSPMGDYVALLLLSRSLLPHIGLPPRIQALFRGGQRMADLPLVEAIQWVDRRVLSAHPGVRPTMEESIAAADRLRSILGAKPDEEGFAALVSSLLKQHDEPVSAVGQLAPQTRTLTLGPDATWAAGPDGARCRLNGPLRRLLVALVRHHATRGGEVLTVWDLLDVGWPGERPLPDAGANRVYVTLTRLRALGLRDVIERFDEGYRLAPETRVVHVDDRRAVLQSLTGPLPYWNRLNERRYRPSHSP